MGSLVGSVFCFTGCGLVWLDYLWFEFGVCGCYGLVWWLLPLLSGLRLGFGLG